MGQTDLPALVAMCIRTNMPKNESMLLLKWFGYTEPLFPNARKLHTELAMAIIEHARQFRNNGRSYKKEANHLFEAWYQSTLAEDMLTEKQQLACAEILNRSLK